VSDACARWLASIVGLSDDPRERAMQVAIMALQDIIEEGWVDCLPMCKVAHRELVQALGEPAVRYEPS
jgi:hypothetical protein